MAAITGIEYKGLRELGTYLKTIGADTEELKTVLNDAGTILVNEARTLAPTGATGKLAASIKANRSASTLKVSAGNNTTVKYAYTFHAIELGKSAGGFTYRVPPHNRSGRPVRGYTRKAYIPNNPFMAIAYENKKQAIYERFVLGVGNLISKTLP